MNNLPVLYTIPKWNLMKGFGYKLQYYIPELDKWVIYKSLTKELLKIGITAKYYYTRWFLSTTEYPKCKICGKELEFVGVRKGFRLSCGSYSCKRSSLSKFRLNYYKIHPEVKELISSSITEILKNNPELNKERGLKLSITQSTEEYKNKISKSRKEVWMNPSDAMKHRRRNSSIDYYSDYENKIIHLDSKWELKFIENCKLNPNIKSVLREPIMIWYYDSTTSKMRRYFPDFLVEYNNGKKELIEIKPNYLLTDPIVKAKESYSIKYCSENNLSYKFITEDHLF